MGEELVVPYSGEIVDVAQPDQCVRALAEIRELEGRIREAKRELTFYLALEFERQGLKTMEFNGVKAELRGGTETAWDISVLEELLAAGLPQERFEQLVKAEVSFKVDAREAKRIAAANEQYSAIIERARNSYTRPHYISIK